jgi:hypothetical protein
LHQRVVSIPSTGDSDAERNYSAQEEILVNKYDGQMESDSLKVRLLQTDPVLGDVDGNLRRLDALVADSADRDLVVAPELATHGYHLSEVPDAMPLRPTA